MAKLTKDEITLVEEALAAMLSNEREAGLDFAREHYLVVGPDGEPAKLKGDWQALIALSRPATDASGGNAWRSTWMAAYERKEAEVKAILAKLKAPTAPPTLMRKSAKARSNVLDAADR